MKTYLTLLILVLFAFQSQIAIAQDKHPSFEGKVIYDVIYNDKTGESTKEEMETFLGNELTYTIKNDHYKNESNGALDITQYYTGGDTLYNKIGSVPGLLWIDVTVDDDSIISHTIEKEVETILGVKCDLLTIVSKEGVSKYYYNKKYPMAPGSFNKHKYGQWKFYHEKTNAIPLKSITEDNEMYFEQIAKEIKEIEIDDSEFTLPNLPRIKSPE